MKASKKKIIKGKTNGGELARQVFHLVANENIGDNDTVLVIRKRVLTKDPILYTSYHYNIIRKFKDLFLIEIVFSIRTNTLKEVVEFINQESI